MAKVKTSARSARTVAKSCGLTDWFGGPECIWCGKHKNSYSPWCSPKCRVLFNKNHVYKDARAVVREQSGGRCARCKTAYDISEMQCNHIVPVRGHRESPSCVHHQTNLEMVCPPCHAIIGIEQDLADGRVPGWRLGLIGEIVQTVDDMLYGNTPVFTQAVLDFNEVKYRAL